MKFEGLTLLGVVNGVLKAVDVGFSSPRLMSNWEKDSKLMEIISHRVIVPAAAEATVFDTWSASMPP